LAQFLARQGRVGEAMTILQKAWLSGRKDQVALAALKVYEAPSAPASEKAQVKSWLEQAIQQGTEVDRLEPKLGTILYMEGRFDEAETIYRNVLNRRPDDAESLNDLAWELAMRDASKSEEALKLINRAIDLHGDLPALINTRGVVLIQSKRFELASTDFRVAKAGDPANPNYAFHLAWALQGGGKTEEAREELRAAERLGLDGKISDPFSRRALGRLRQTLASD
jgi:tetratricopeptide (TPR) repeat protein